MNSMVYCVLKPEVDDVQAVQQSISIEHKEHESIQELKEAMFRHFRLEINTSNPVLIIPRHFESKEHFSLDLGAVSINNKCEFDANNDLLDIMSIKTSKFKLASFNDEDNKYIDITSNICTTIHFKRKMNAYCYEPDNIFTVHVPEYNARMRHEQYTLILKLLSDNLTAEPLLSPIPYNVHHIKHMNLDAIQTIAAEEDKPASSSFELHINKASLTLIHDLQKGRKTDVCLAKLQLKDVIIAHLSRRSHHNTFSVSFGSAMISDARNLPNHVFDKILCRVQDIVAPDKLNKDILERDKHKVPSIKIEWDTKENKEHSFNSQTINVSIVDSCSYCIGSTLCHLYDWFTTTNDPFIDKYPATKQSVSDLDTKEDDCDSEFNLNVRLINSRIILLRDLTQSNCDALVTHGNTIVTMKSIHSFTEMFEKKDVEVKLNDFKLHFAKGNHLGFGRDDRIQVLQPSNFNFKTTYYQNFETKEELYEKVLSLKKITIIGVTTQRALALRDIISNFTTNFNENAYINNIEHKQDDASDESDTTSNNLARIDEIAAITKYKSELKIKFERFDVFMHDETVQNQPKIFSFGFHDFNLSGYSHSESEYFQKVTINMLWHSNKYYNVSWSPLVCPWNCAIEIRHSTNVVIEGKEPLDVFVSDIVIRGFIQNATKLNGSIHLK